MSVSSGGRGRKFKSSHPDQPFPFQVNSLPYPQVGHGLFAGPLCGSFAGIIRGSHLPYSRLPVSWSLYPGCCPSTALSRQTRSRPFEARHLPINGSIEHCLGSPRCHHTTPCIGNRTIVHCGVHRALVTNDLWYQVCAGPTSAGHSADLTC